MLKIKESVDLKELEKFGFDYNDKYKEYWKIICEGRRGQCFSITINEDRYLWGFAEGADGSGEESYIDDTLYDLIKADMVEKVEE